MSDPCIRCGEPASRELRALQVRTLPIRSLAGEKRVQALGEEVAAHVCEACAAKQLSFLKDVRNAVRKKVLVFGGVLAGGIIITALTLLLNRERILLMPGIGAVICGVLGIAEAVQKAREKAAALRSMPEAEALEEAAFDVMVSSLPSKNGSDDLTYIPINEKTLARKNGDLMILYRLLPEIAKQAWNRMHGISDEEKPPEQNEPAID